MVFGLIHSRLKTDPLSMPSAFIFSEDFGQVYFPDGDEERFLDEPH